MQARLRVLGGSVLFLAVWTGGDARRSIALVVGADGGLRLTRWGDGDFLVFVLQLVELVVNAALGEQLLVRAHLAYAALVHDDNLVGALHRREAMRDDQGGAALDHAAERFAHAEFGFGVDARSRFVKNQ